ncbi:hypothetical protein GQ44DRAFT_239224 [Phaeosphaeriaceae sp. PMI808]|nr:hypothetical protein GQ44DRAFT_239224 [Phaeosphaeriaceae sp. PMI808]
MATEIESKLDKSLPKTILFQSPPPTTKQNDQISPSSSSSHTTTTTLHIYAKSTCHKYITPTPIPSKDRRSGPTASSKKSARKAQKARKSTGLPPTDDGDPDPNAFFLHKPYLAFHAPPYVLYTGSSSQHNGTPVILIHAGCWWRTYTLQLGRDFAREGVLDARGVVCFAHDGGGAGLKGYRVRRWRLWGESGKEYVRGVNRRRREEGGGECGDDVVGGKGVEKACVDQTVQLKWSRPFSRAAREYRFEFGGLRFCWKGTGTVRESRTCGFFLRYNHLKLVVRLPDEVGPEICVAKFTSSVAEKKSGTLVVFDGALLGVAREYLPEALELDEVKENEMEEIKRGVDEKIARLKKSSLYQVIVATATCMIMSEKEKRHLIFSILGLAAEGAGG